MLKTIASSILCCLLFSTALFAQTADEKQVADRIETLRKAMIAADKNTLDELTAQDLSYGHSNGLVEDKAAFIDEFATGKSVFITLALTEQTIRIKGDVAIVRHHFMADTNNNQVPGKADILVLQIWQKQEGVWKLLARQAVKVAAPAK